LIDLKDESANYEYYKQPNGREAGIQITGFDGRPSERQKAIMELLPISCDNVVDFGCADGSLLIMLIRKWNLKAGYGIDLWRDGVEWGNKYCLENNLKIKLEEKSILDYSGPFSDIGIMAEVLEHMIDPVEVLKHVFRFVNTLIITLPIKRPPITQEEIEILKTRPEEHLTDYSNDAVIAKQLREAGLCITAKTLTNDGGWINFVASVSKRNNDLDKYRKYMFK